MALLARSVRSSFSSLRSGATSTISLPIRAANITTVSHNLDTSNTPDPLVQSGQRKSKEIQTRARPDPELAKHSKPSNPAEKPTTHARSDSVSTALTPSIQQLLPLLHSQQSHYATLHIHGRPYLITCGDTIRLPFLMPKVQSGDVLRLNRATHIGSRDYTLKAPEPIKGSAEGPKQVFYLDDRLFTCRATVLGVQSEPLRVMEKTKRRRRHIKHVKSKHKYTVLRISELEFKSLEEYERALKSE